MINARRQNPRIQSVNEVRITDAITDLEKRSMTTLELGTGGCLLNSSRPLGIGRVMVMSITLEEKPVKAIGKVLYEYPTKEGSISSGVEFIYVDTDDNEALTQFVLSS